MSHKKLPNFEKFGEVNAEPQSRIGVITAENMVYNFNAIPHAWISEKADITRLEELRQQYKAQVKEQGGSLTTTAILTKAICSVLRKMPQFNASYDPETKTVHYKKYYNIGIAVDTPKGLLVPVIKDADRKSLTEISIELKELSIRTRDGKNKPTDLEGGSFSISNIGRNRRHQYDLYRQLARGGYPQYHPCRVRTRLERLRIRTPPHDAYDHRMGSPRN